MDEPGKVIIMGSLLFAQLYQRKRWVDGSFCEEIRTHSFHFFPENFPSKIFPGVNSFNLLPMILNWLGTDTVRQWCWNQYVYNLVGWSPKICSIHLCTILHHIYTFKQATYKYQWESFLYLWPIQFQHKKPSQCYLLEPRIYPLSVLWSLLFLFLGPLYLPHSHSVPIRCWSR